MLNGHSVLSVPQNLEAERSVIGGLLYDPARLVDVAAVLAPDDFLRASHTVIFEALLDMQASGTPIDPLGVAEELTRRGKLHFVGGHDALSDLLMAVPHAANAVYHAQIVRQKAIARRLMEVCTRTIAAVRANQHTADELLAAALANVVSLLETGRTRGVAALADLAPRVLEAIVKRCEEGCLDGLSTGLADLDMLLGGMRAGQLLILAARPAMGKAQPLDANVLTPSGFVPMGSLRVGDFAIGSDGSPVKVLGVYPQGELPVFRVTMTDGSSTECCDEHLWFTQTRNERRCGLVGSVKPLHAIRPTLSRDSSDAPNHALPTVGPIHFGPRPWPAIEPYLMGVLIGDGSFTAPSIALSNPESDILQRVSDLLPIGDSLHRGDDGLNHRIVHAGRNGPPSFVARAIRRFGLSGHRSVEKFIPPDFLLGSYECRLAFLRGLLDTDGYVTESGRSVELSTSSPRLAADAAFLVRSLGGVVSTRVHTPAFSYRGERRTGSPSSRMVVRMPDGVVPVSSEKHLAKWRGKPAKYHFRSIASIEPAGFKPCQCIRVNASDHLYVTDDFILTHNTSLALNFVDHISVECGVPVLVVTLEMDEGELVERMGVARARLDGQRVRFGQLDAGRLGALRTAFEELARAPVWFDGDPGQDILRVLATARMLAARHQVGLVVIDYLQLLEPESDDDSRQEQVARISRRLKALARSLKVPVLALSQLNRMVEVRPDRRPRMADLRESGAIENDADVVMLLHRPEYYDPNDQPGVAELIVAKNRSGPTATVKLAFDRQSMRFDLLARENMGGY